MDCFNSPSFLKLESLRLFLHHPFRSTRHPPSVQMSFSFSVTRPNIPGCSSQLPLHPDSVLMFILLLCNALLYTHTPHQSQKQSKIYPLSVAKWGLSLHYSIWGSRDAMPQLPLRQTNLFICLNLTGWAALMSQTQRRIIVRVTGILGTRFYLFSIFFF